ncbi:hypothetical protein TPY_3547 [Sulfobacillus acidophilus TPY]|nr:hypothetical protein TPY_3547 [Sulfobacillus acidophilus TPY]
MTDLLWWASRNLVLVIASFDEITLIVKTSALGVNAAI